MDCGLLLQLHALTLAACSYALLTLVYVIQNLILYSMVLLYRRKHLLDIVSEENTWWKGKGEKERGERMKCMEMCEG